MSVQIKDQATAGDYCQIAAYTMPEEVMVYVLEAGRSTKRSRAVVSRADFLAAVETECGVRLVPADAIVFERAELPYLSTRVGSVSAKAFTWSKSSDPDDLREIAACYLAAAEYLAAHPPVPPVSAEDVETLAGLLRDADLTGAAFLSTVASRLLTDRGPHGERVSVTK